MANNFIYKIFTLNEDEELVKVVRQSKLRLIVSLILPIILIAAPFFFLFPLFYWGTWGGLIFFLALVLGIFWLIRNLIIWYFKVLVITNQRIVDIDQQGIFHRLVSDIPINKIQDVFYQIKGLTQTLSRIGTIQIILTDNKTKIEINNIPQPQKIQQLILHSRLDNLEDKLKTTKLSAQELVNLVKKIKVGIGEEKLREIIEEKEKEKEKNNIVRS